MHLPRKYIIGALFGLFLLLAAGVSAFFVIKSRQAANNVKPTPGVLPITKPSYIHVVTGTVKIKNVNTNEEKIVQKGQDIAVQEGDNIQTDTNTVATIDFNDGTLARLSSESTILYGTHDTTMHFDQIVGNVYYRFKKAAGFRDGLEVETNDALAAVRGTTLSIFKNQNTKLVVTSSQVEFFQKNSAGVVIPESKVLVDPQMQAESATDSATLTFPLTSKPQELTNKEEAWLDFNQLADQLYDQGPPDLEDFKTLEDLALNYINESNITPAPTSPVMPTANPTSSISPTPTVAAVQKTSEMFGTGYNTGTVQTDAGSFVLSCIGASKSSTKVITDSANENDCKNDCPVKPLADYITSNGGFAGMNGMYFCPPDYPACADKKNSFDTLFFNSRVKRYINSDNNVYSVIPFLAVNGDGSPRFIAHTQEWGRDTGIQAGIAGNPLLIQGGSNVTGNYSLDDKQQNTKSNRGAFVEKGNNIYLCVTKGTTVPDSAKVYETLKVDNAINIDGGGSTALWVNGGYKFGPGRALPNAIVFANR